MMRAAWKTSREDGGGRDNDEIIDTYFNPLRPVPISELFNVGSAAQRFFKSLGANYIWALS